MLMLTYIAYIKFWGEAFFLRKADNRFVWYYYRSAFPVIWLYIIWGNIARNFDVVAVSQVLFIAVRFYLTVFGFIAVIVSLKKRQNMYYYYLAGGTAVIVIFGIFSTLVQTAFNKELAGITAYGWMLMGYFFDIVFFSAAIGYRFRVEAIERMNAMQQLFDQQQLVKQKELETLQAVYDAREEERSRISVELHDDLGSGLSTIRLLSKNEGTMEGNNLERISVQSKELLDKMSEIIWAMNMKDDQLPSLLYYIRSQSAKILQDAGIAYSFRVTEHIPDVPVSGIVRRHIYLLVKECIHNIVKHAGATHVHIELLADEQLCISVQDNGKGFDKNLVSAGNGLQNMQLHSNAVGGQLDVNSHPGTKIIFKVNVAWLSHESVSKTGKAAC